MRWTASVSGRSSTRRLLPGNRGKSLVGRASSSTTTTKYRFQEQLGTYPRTPFRDLGAWERPSVRLIPNFCPRAPRTLRSAGSLFPTRRVQAFSSSARNATTKYIRPDVPYPQRRHVSRRRTPVTGGSSSSGEGEDPGNGSKLKHISEGLFLVGIIPGILTRAWLFSCSISRPVDLGTS